MRYTLCLALIMTTLADAGEPRSAHPCHCRPPERAPAPGGQSTPAVASDGRDHLVVWFDSRNGGTDIFGARVSHNGDVLDHGGIAISTAPNDQLDPAVAFDGTNYLVVWSDNRNGSPFVDNFNIFGARVARDGTVLDSGAFAIGNTTANQGPPALAFDGHNYLVAWVDTRNGNSSFDIFAARVSPTGTVLDPGGIPVSLSGAAQARPAVSCDGGECLVAWQDARNGGATQSEIFGARVTAGGSVLDPAGVLIAQPGANGVGYPALVFDERDYMAAWDDNGNGHIAGARVTASATVLDPSGLPFVSGHPANPTLAFDGHELLLAWGDSRNDLGDVFATRITRDGHVRDDGGFGVAVAPGIQDLPAADFGRHDYLVSWLDTRLGGNHIFAARVTREGRVLDPCGILVSDSP
jgi:hypothetical protein